MFSALLATLTTHNTRSFKRPRGFWSLCVIWSPAWLITGGEMIKEGSEGVFGISGYTFFKAGISGSDTLNCGISGYEYLWDRDLPFWNTGFRDLTLIFSVFWDWYQAGIRDLKELTSGFRDLDVIFCANFYVLFRLQWPHAYHWNCSRSQIEPHCTVCKAITKFW